MGICSYGSTVNRNLFSVSQRKNMRARKEVNALNEYCRGALEALSWVKLLLASSRKDFEKMVDRAKEDILSGCALDFPERLKAVARP